MSPFETITMKLRNRHIDGYIDVVVRPDFRGGECPEPLERIELVTKEGNTYIFQLDSILISEKSNTQGYIPYSEIVGVIWICREVGERARMKNSGQFDRLIVQRSGGSDVLLSGLGQAVFPLLHSLQSIAEMNLKNGSDR